MSAVEQFPNRIQITFGGCPVEDAKPLKVLILGYDYEPVIAGVLPDRTTGTTRQTSVADVDAAWVQIRELGDKPRREILVEEQHLPLSWRGYSLPAVRAPRQTPGRRGCRRASVAENRPGSAARSYRRQDTKARHRP
jgi:hypothetical protein